MTLLRQRPDRYTDTWGPSEGRSLRRGLTELGLHPSADQLERLEAYAGLLLKWNRTYNLLGATSPRDLVDAHLLDALAALPVLQRWLPETEAGGRPVLFDIGAGAGLPGLALAIMQPEQPIVLVEPIGKKAAFMRQAIAHCRLSNARVFEGKIEDLDKVEAAGGSDAAVTGAPCFICRAFTSLARFAALCRPHTRQGSLLFAMKASRVADEVTELLDAQIVAIEHLAIAGRAVARNLVVMRPHQAGAASTHAPTSS